MIVSWPYPMINPTKNRQESPKEAPGQFVSMHHQVFDERLSDFRSDGEMVRCSSSWQIYANIPRLHRNLGNLKWIDGVEWHITDFTGNIWGSYGNELDLTLTSTLLLNPFPRGVLHKRHRWPYCNILQISWPLPVVGNGWSQFCHVVCWSTMPSSCMIQSDSKEATQQDKAEKQVTSQRATSMTQVKHNKEKNKKCPTRHITRSKVPAQSSQYKTTQAIDSQESVSCLEFLISRNTKESAGVIPDRPETVQRTL